MALQDIGVRAVVENLANFKSSIDEMNAKTNSYTEKATSGFKAAQFQVDAFAQSIGTSATKIGLSMAAAGAAITASLGLMGKSAIDEDINIKRLATTMENAGVSYDNVRVKLEALIATTQRKTGVADTEQRDILNRLILTTGNYAKSLELLPTVLDLAAAGEMDATTAATYLGKAYNDLAAGAETVSVRFGQASLQFKSMEDIQKRVGGQAEALVNPFNVLKASIGDVGESLGTVLIPILKEGIAIIADFAVKIKDFADANPLLTQVMVSLGLGIGIVLSGLGGLILILPSVIAGIAALGTVFHVALGPIGLISLGIAGLIAISTTLYQNWDKVSVFLAKSWENIKIAFAEAIKFITNTVLMPFIEFYSKMVGFIAEGVGKLVGFFNEDLGNSIQAFAEKIKNSRGEITAWADNIITDSMINKAALQAEKLAEATSVGIKEIAISPEMQAKMDDFASTATKIGDAWNYANTEAGKLGLTMNDMIGYLLAQGNSVDDLKAKYELYGDDIQKWADGMGVSLNDVALASKTTSGSMVIDAEKFTSEAKKLSEEYVKDQKSALDKVLSDEKSAYQERIDNIDKLLQAQLDAYDKELEGLNDQLSEIDRLQKESNDSQKKSELETAISTEYDLKRKAELNRQLDDLILNSNNETWQKQRQIDLEDLAANETNADVKKNLEDELAQYLVGLDLETQRTKIENKIESVNEEKRIAQDNADYAKSLEDQKMTDFKANIELQKAALDTQLVEANARYDQELIDFKAKNTVLIDETVAFVKRMNAELSKIQKVNIGSPGGGGIDTSLIPAGTGIDNGPTWEEWGTFATGGKITKPMWALLGEGGENEYVVPESKLGSFISKVLGSQSKTQKMIIPSGINGNVNNSRSTNYNINANYSKSQPEASLRLDLEAIAMMARS
jgi:hypothetical protein